MTPGDRSRLLKILARTGSAHDGEALTAIRKANEMLGRHGLSWQELLRAPGADSPAGETERNGLTAKKTMGSRPKRSPTWSPRTEATPTRDRDPFPSQVFAARLRSFLRAIWRPLRIVLGPLTVGAYAVAWAMEAEGWGDVIGRGFAGTAGVLAASLVYFEIGLATAG